jgi:hypothetical protein
VHAFRGGGPRSLRRRNALCYSRGGIKHLARQWVMYVPTGRTTENIVKTKAKGVKQ